jgi:outer membrane immunogenic protein
MDDIARKALAAILTLAAPLPAAAADLPRAAPVPYMTAPYGVYGWAGFYLGANLGYQWGQVANLGLDPSGVTGGIQIGYNWQTGQFVFGAETDFQLSGAEDTFAAYKFANPWFGTLRGRAGIAMSNVLIYATGGLAYGRGRLDIAGLSESQPHFGWAAGAGIEFGFTPSWSAKVEYLYVSLDKEGYAITGANHGIDSSLVRLGVNYRF